MKVLHFAAVALASISALPAIAATQGSLGTTSTATFGVTANGPATPRLVQVLDVEDATFNNSTQSERSPSTPGVTMTFCVVDTYAGAVTLQVSNDGTNGIDSNGFLLKATSGTTVTIYPEVTNVSVSSLWGAFSGANSFTATIPAGQTVSAAAACGVGNVKIHVSLPASQTLPETIGGTSFTTTITMVATPI
ncbi:MAG: hypothetical protein ACK5TK_11070 [Betaproteobacteria bacterium]